MSATITLKQTTAQGSAVAIRFIQYCLLIAVLFFVFGIVNFFLDSTRAKLGSSPYLSVASDSGGATAAAHSALRVEAVDLAVLSEQPEPQTASPAAGVAVSGAMPTQAPVALSPRMQGALDYVKRRYRVSPEALVPVFEIAQLIGSEMRIDPLLIVAIIGIESGFNPFAESAVGARGLMQIIPRMHRDKVPMGAGDGSLLDPAINIRVGVKVLDEAIRRRGGLVSGLQQYAGSSEPDGVYASKVLAEKERLEQAARRGTPAA